MEENLGAFEEKRNEAAETAESAGKGGKRLLHVFSPRRGHNTARGKMKMRFLRAPSRQGEGRGNILLRRLLVSHPSFRKEYAEPVTKDNHARIGKTN